MEDRSIERRSAKNITPKEHRAIPLGRGAGGSFFSMFTAAFTIRIPTAALIPLKAWAMTWISRKLSKNTEIR